MERRNCLKGLAVAALPFLGAPASASSTITVDGISFAEGAVLGTASLWQGNESNGGPVTAVGDVLTGTGRVSLIENGSGGTLWSWRGSGSRELTLAFSGFELASITNLGGVTRYGFVGGTVRLYSDAAGNSNPAGGLASAGTFSDGSAWLELAPRPVADGYTLTAMQLGGQLAGFGFLDVTGGLAASYLDSNLVTIDGLPGAAAADLRFESLGVLEGPGQGWAVSGSARIEAHAVVPVPGSLALLGSGLAWLGLRRRSAA